jgi:uncharacterized protein with von Willebrand factor type A (vWA) domain
MEILDRNPPQGQFTANLLIFTRLLRHLGLKVSSHQVKGLAEALTIIDISRRDDFYYTARALLVPQRAHQKIFDQAFDLFWSNRANWQLEPGLRVQEVTPSRSKETRRTPLDFRQDSNLNPDLRHQEFADEPSPDDQPWLTSMYSTFELLRQKDFSEFTEEEFALARRLIQNIRWLPNERRTRRWVGQAKQASQLDLPRSVRTSLKHGGEFIDLAWLKRKSKPRPIVILCDISGSMAPYSRVFLHFMFMLVQHSSRLETFVFGTRLTHITRALQKRDIDAALLKTSQVIFDWAGGTRIGQSLRDFNCSWARRVLGQSTVVIIISDGWDRGDIQVLKAEIQRLRRRASRLIWLNPLLGSPGYEPLVRGIQTILPYVDDFLPIHNLVSLESLAETLRNDR